MALGLLHSCLYVRYGNNGPACVGSPMISRQKREHQHTMFHKAREFVIVLLHTNESLVSNVSVFIRMK